jgi:nucleoside-diphosphate-sugar epimerase
MKILITGGSGFLGINLIRHLHQNGHTQLTSLDIAPFDYPDEDKSKVTPILGDIRDEGLVDRLMAEHDQVIHCAAALPLCSEEEIHSTDVDGTRTLLAAAHRHGIRRFVYISSTSVYGVPDHHPLVENDKMVGVGPYGQAKIDAETLCGEYRRQGMCIPVIRPKSFIGPERLGIFAILYEWAREGHNFPLIGRGDNRYQLLDVEDLCAAILLTMTLPEDRVNDVFNIGAREFTTMREDFGIVLKQAGFGKRIIMLPAGPAIFILRIIEKLGLSPVYEWVYDTAAKDSFVSIEKAERLLGFSPRHSNQDAFLRNYAWYLDHADELSKINTTGVTHRVPWKQGILKVAKWLF